MEGSQAPESFRSLLLRYRGRTGLIQRDLAVRAGVSLRSVQDWESGVTLPTAERLQALVRTLLEEHGLTPGHELGVRARLHHLALPASEFQAAGDPPPNLGVAHQPPVRGVEDAAVAHQQSTPRHRDDLAEGRYPVPQHAVVAETIGVYPSRLESLRRQVVRRGARSSPP
jgi:DNA-binding XRE family transcriptional regulator